MAETSATTPATNTAPANAASHDTTAPAAPPLERSEDERHLQSIFPDLDETTIHDCYVLCERNVERTVEFLLGTDQNDAPSNTNAVPAGMSQSEIDEQLARQFEQEELAAAAAAWNPRPVAAPAPNARPFNQDSHVQGSQATPESNEPNFQEQFNKFAETGKKTITSIFNKVREKIKEFEAPPPGGPSNPQMQQHQQQHYQYYAPEPVSPRPNVQTQGNSPTPYQSAYAPPAVPPPGATESHQAPIPGPSASSSVAAPVAADNPVTSTNSPSTATPNIDLSKTAFLPRKPAPLPENKPEDLTESPFEDRGR